MNTRRGLAMVVAMGLVVSGWVVLTARQQVYADPPSGAAYRPLTGVGSATTQDVMNALAEVITVDGQKVVGSFNASGSERVTTFDPSNLRTCDFPRPATDEAAMSRLLFSAINRDTCVSFARMTFPYQDGAPTDAGIAYLPFGQDGVTYAVRETSQIPRQLSRDELRGIYLCQTPLIPMLPGSGSGLRSSWLKFLGINEVDVPTCVRSTGADGKPIRENEGTALVDDDAISPFSIASYAAQSGGMITSRLGRAELATVADPSGQAPIVANTRDYADDVSYVLRSSSALPRQLTVDELVQIYTCTVSGVRPLLPASGPVRTAWLNQLGLDEDQVASGAYPCIVTVDADGNPIAENRGVVMVNDTDVMPHSISAYVRQILDRAPDVRGRATVGVIGNKSPYANLPIVLNTDYLPALRHRVYNAVPIELTDATRQGLVNAVFSGPNSLVCQESRIIESFGFASIPAADPQPCGTTQLDSSRVPGQVRSLSVAAPVALDQGNVPGSGAQVTVKHGACVLVGGFTNAPGALSSVTTAAWVVGPSCRVTLTTAYFNHSSGGGVGPEEVIRDIFGSGTVNHEHRPGMWEYHHFGANNVSGHAVRWAQFRVQDLTVGGNGSNCTVVVGPFEATFQGPHITSGETINTLYWDHVQGASGFRVFRRNVTIGEQWQFRAWVPAVGSGFNEEWADSDIRYLYKYEYQVFAFAPNGDQIGNTAPVTATAARPQRFKHLVVMGDSYASGEGGGDYWDGTCHRSRFGYGPHIRDPLDALNMIGMVQRAEARLSILACSGAQTDNMVANLPESNVQSGMEAWYSQSGVLDPPQGRVLHPDYQVRMLARTHAFMPVDAILLSIGGNDAGFANVLSHCVKLGSCDTPEYEAERRNVIRNLRGVLAETYRQVIANSGDAAIQVIGYPKLFPQNGGTTNCAMVVGLPLFRLTTGEMLMLNRLADELNSVIAETVAAMSYPFISFVDVRNLFSGHDMCAGGAAWLHRVGIPVRESAHPNRTGFDALAAHLSGAFLPVGTPSGRR